MAPIHIAQQDWRETLAEAAAMGGPDLILTDPPYWTLNRWRNVGTTTRLGGHRDESKRDDSEWFATIDTDDLWELMCDMQRTLKQDRHAYLMCDGQTLAHVLGYAHNPQQGQPAWDNVKPLVWDKVNQGMGYHWRCRHEFVVMFDKGRRRLNDLSAPDVLTHKMIRGGYPTEKPVSLMRQIIENSTQPGELVCDPFMGGGSVAVACAETGWLFVGGDISEEAVRTTSSRLDGLSLSLGLFHHNAPQTSKDAR